MAVQVTQPNPLTSHQAQSLSLTGQWIPRHQVVPGHLRQCRRIWAFCSNSTLVGITHCSTQFGSCRHAQAKARIFCTTRKYPHFSTLARYGTVYVNMNSATARTKGAACTEQHGMAFAVMLGNHAQHLLLLCSLATRISRNSYGTRNIALAWN